jgi:hypothetical protein
MIVEQEYRTIQLRQLDVLFGLIICETCKHGRNVSL